MLKTYTYATYGKDRQELADKINGMVGQTPPDRDDVVVTRILHFQVFHEGPDYTALVLAEVGERGVEGSTAARGTNGGFPFLEDGCVDVSFTHAPPTLGNVHRLLTVALHMAREAVPDALSRSMGARMLEDIGGTRTRVADYIVAGRHRDKLKAALLNGGKCRRKQASDSSAEEFVAERAGIDKWIIWRAPTPDNPSWPNLWWNERGTVDDLLEQMAMCPKPSSGLGKWVVE